MNAVSHVPALSVPTLSVTALTVLADPTRTRILQLIRAVPDGRMLVGQLAEELGLRQPTVSHHMSALHAEGIVVRKPEGRRVWYSIHPDHADRLDAVLGTITAPGDRTEIDLERVVGDLATRFAGVFDRETVDGYVHESYQLLSARGSAPLVASRSAAFAATRLADLARMQSAAGAAAGTATPTVLFVCVQNAGRSQLAAGILRHLAGNRVNVRTAGSAPAADLRSSIVKALDEIGVTIGDEFPKPLTDDAVRAADIVITMGCGDACPVYPGRRYLDWDLDDPVDKPLTVIREIRDDIEQRVRALIPELLG